MDPQFWLDRWQREDIGFHQSSVHDLLEKHWPGFNLAKGSEVLVPLCGKSFDMVWLANRGHSVLGIELSELAVDAFFKERSRTPGVETVGDFKVKRAGPFEIWCGDYFAFPDIAARRVAAVFDRAALVAMPRTRQQPYAEKLASLTRTGSPVLLVTLDYDPSEMQGPPFPIPASEVTRLFESAFKIKCLETRDGNSRSDNLRKRGLKHVEEAVYVLERR